ncbi:hypothetical protein FBU30_007531 [Linnemannia zychae]|nr:hypothetical protein FBU30_007531 [Linnemannia zychae]
MSYNSCLLTDCMSYLTIYQTCVAAYPSYGPDQDKCLCTTSAIASYKTCYPCASTQPSTGTPFPTIDQYTSLCNSANGPNIGGGFTFTGLPTTTDRYPPAPTTTGTNGSNNSNNGGNTSEKSSSNTGLYAGIGAGVGIVVLGLAFFIWHRNRKPKDVGKHTPVKTEQIPSVPAIQPVNNYHQPPPAPAVPVFQQPQPQQPPAPVVPVFQHPPPQVQPQPQPLYQDQYQYNPQPLSPSQYPPQPQNGYYAQPGVYQDPNMYDPNQQQQGQYPSVSAPAPPAPFPQPSPTFASNDYYQQQQQQQQHTFSPVATAVNIPPQEPMPMPEQSNPYGLASPSVGTTTAYSPAMTTTTTSYDAQTPAVTSAGLAAAAHSAAYEAPASTTIAMSKVSTHGPQAIADQGHHAVSKNPQYIEPFNNTSYHN